MKGVKTIYICEKCEYKSPKWLGKCPSCSGWNTFIEDVIEVSPQSSPPKRTSSFGDFSSEAVAYGDLKLPEFIRLKTGTDELDRVLGGGLVNGSVVLLSGEPGIGKSTLLLQISDSLGKSRKVLYVSGEESYGQLKLRAQRLGIFGSNLFVLTETNIDNILSQINKVSPDVVIVDSVQTVFTEKVSSAPGSINQVKECALAFIEKAKSKGISVILVGHVNKEGSIAGPKLLEHMVDAVLYFEGERQQTYRIIRAIKNRYGSTNEIGVFQMTDTGLDQVENPSETLLSDRPKNMSGNCAVCTIEGTRPIIAEIQALVTKSVLPTPRRTASGIDYNKMCLIVAVLEKRLGLRFSSCDTFLNVIGGLRLDEPAVDMAVALAMMSSITDKVIPDDLIAIGEIGLAGECRGVSNLELRLKEAARLGFTKAVIPYKSFESKKFDCNIELIPIKGVFEAVKLLKSDDN